MFIQEIISPSFLFSGLNQCTWWHDNYWLGMCHFHNLTAPLVAPLLIAF